MSDEQSPVVRTYVEMASRDLLRPGREVAGFEFVRMAEDDPAAVKVLHDEVAESYGWSTLPWTVEKWREAMVNPLQGIFALRVDGVDGGFMFLAARENAVVEICLFGLRPQYVGRGFGGHALTVACRTAWDFRPEGAEAATKVILDTCTKDHPRALPNYLARGFVVTRTEVGPRAD